MRRWAWAIGFAVLGFILASAVLGLAVRGLPAAWMGAIELAVAIACGVMGYRRTR